MNVFLEFIRNSNGMFWINWCRIATRDKMSLGTHSASDHNPRLAQIFAGCEFTGGWDRSFRKLCILLSWMFITLLTSSCTWTSRKLTVVCRSVCYHVDGTDPK